MQQAQFGASKFSADTCQRLLKVFDVDNSGTINLQEYIALHKFIMTMQSSFYVHDKDKSGKLDEKEIADVLSGAGFVLSPATLTPLVARFAKTGATGTVAPSARPVLVFEQFICLAAFLGQLRSTFELWDTQRTGKATITLEQLITIGSRIN